MRVFIAVGTSSWIFWLQLPDKAHFLVHCAEYARRRQMPTRIISVMAASEIHND